MEPGPQAAQSGPDDVRVSVVIPTFNGSKYIAETLRAVLAQTHEAVEIIVVDDGSTDDTLAVVTAVAPQAHRLQQQNAGVSAARNRGLAAARGRYACFLDQDDIWHAEHLTRQILWMDRNPDCGALVCPLIHWHPQDGVYVEPATFLQRPPTLTADPAFSGWVYHQFLKDCWALTSATMLRVDAVRAVGGFDATLRYSEDWDLWLRLSQQVPFALLNWPPVLYRHHPVQGSRALRRHDYRTELLLRYARAHGLASADGRAMPRDVFAQTVANYGAEFGYHHLQLGHRWTGVHALAMAWWRRPRHIKRLMQAAAGSVGWRPGR
ncbi:MAG: glycosyltransferase family 2 protein [Rubrivivax sp.]|nr:glycosyltransferase family 2 protein [Rubrivivax sp.]